MTQFRGAFVRSLWLTDRWLELNSRFQKSDEHIADYFYDKLRLCRNLSLPFVEVRDHIILGIYSEEQSLYAMGRSHVSPNELLLDLQDRAPLRSSSSTF